MSSATANTASVGSIDLAWTTTALGGSFDRYEIERLDPDGATWYPIAYVNTEATVTYSDYSARRSVAESYRLRVRHTNGTVSLPGSTLTATLTLAGSYFIVPESTSLNHAAEINMPGVGFSRSRERIEQTRMGRDFVTVTKHPRYRGKVLTGTIDTTGSAGWLAASSWIYSLTEADVSQTILVNDVGERWIVDVEFGDGTVAWAQGDTGDWQQIGFRAVEVDDVPAIVEVS